MFFDLNVPVPPPATQPNAQAQSSKKIKGKQPATQSAAVIGTVVFSSGQTTRLEARIDLLVRLGYTVFAFNQITESKVDPKSHVNTLDPLLGQLRKREGILFLKRLTIVLDENSEKGFGLTIANGSLFSPYDILALQPTTEATFSAACLTHSVPSTLTTHIISLPLSSPRLPFRLKHTLVRTALKNGAVFELCYTGALSGESERRNWWANAREVVRVTKGKGLLLSGGAENDVELRAPRDAGNLITLLGLAQNLAHDASTTTPKSLILRAQTRKTYRAILSEPILMLPPTSSISASEEPPAAKCTTSKLPVQSGPQAVADDPGPSSQIASSTQPSTAVISLETPGRIEASSSSSRGTKRPRTPDADEDNIRRQAEPTAANAGQKKSLETSGNRKKKRKDKDKGLGADLD